MCFVFGVMSYLKCSRQKEMLSWSHGSVFTKVVNCSSRHLFISWDNANSFFFNQIFSPFASSIQSGLTDQSFLKILQMKLECGMKSDINLSDSFVVFWPSVIRCAFFSDFMIPPWTSWHQSLRSSVNCSMLPDLIPLNFSSLLLTSLKFSVFFFLL